MTELIGYGLAFLCRIRISVYSNEDQNNVIIHVSHILFSTVLSLKVRGAYYTQELNINFWLIALLYSGWYDKM